VHLMISFLKNMFQRLILENIPDFKGKFQTFVMDTTIEGMDGIQP